jgi:CheY-like chemotaxis protein
VSRNKERNGSPVVLVAAEEWEVLRMVRDALRRRGFLVIPARSGQEVVHLARAKRPSLILMEIMMPLLDGYAAARVLRRDATTCAIPIIAFHAPHRLSRRTGGQKSDGEGGALTQSEERELFNRIRQALDARHESSAYGYGFAR